MTEFCLGYCGATCTFAAEAMDVDPRMRAAVITAEIVRMIINLLHSQDIARRCPAEGEMVRAAVSNKWWNSESTVAQQQTIRRCLHEDGTAPCTKK
jgi:hypothetical protein